MIERQQVDDWLSKIPKFHGLIFIRFQSRFESLVAEQTPSFVLQQFPGTCEVEKEVSDLSLEAVIINSEDLLVILFPHHGGWNLVKVYGLIKIDHKTIVSYANKQLCEILKHVIVVQVVDYFPYA